MKLHLPVRFLRAVVSCMYLVTGYTLSWNEVWAEAQNLSYEGSLLIWDTQSPVFKDAGGEAASFASGDNVNFQGETAVTLGEDISAGCINIASGADVSINLADYELAAERIALSGTLDVGEPLVIGEGVTLAVESSSAVLKSGLILTENGTLNMDAAADLSGASLSLQKGTVLTLTDSFLASGDGCVYELFTNVGTLQRTNGSTLQLSDDTLYYFFFDISSSVFWGNATLKLTEDGTLQLVRHSVAVQDAVVYTNRESGNNLGYNYHEGVTFRGNSTNDSGGAICGKKITMEENGKVTFSENSAACYGGAIYGDSDSTITIRGNGGVIFSENSAGFYGGAIFGSDDSTITIRANGCVTFSRNSAGLYGGAICNYYGIELSSNASVMFNENSADYIGGAIAGDTIYLGGNDNVAFIKNTALIQNGGAIDANELTIGHNGSVTFSENSAACYGGAITGDTAFDTVSVQLSYNDTVTFIENTAGIAGGAIDVDVLTIDHNGSVTFSENSAGSDGGAISFHDWLQITHNDSVIFSGNSGGAISGHKGSQLTIRDNGSVTFSENSVCGQFAEGGAINVWGDISLEFNDSVTFSGNSVCGQYAEGGAIYGEINGDITLWDNDSVTFSGNTARGEALNSILSGANGGAIAGDTITLRKNGSVTFSENSACGGSTSSAQGGAIAGSMITLSNNGSVTFSGNSVCGENLNTTVTYAYGGAIFANSSSSIKLSGNESVEFRENSVCGRYAQGGAIYGPGDITLNDNGSVKFSGNSASTPHSDAYANGGAIAGDTITLRNNNSVTFSENSAYCGSTSSGRGGAIMGSMITLSNNGSVTFSENSANGIIARGGAIAGNMITLSDNGNVTFSGNTATAPTSNPPNGTYGGAIYTTGDLKIRNNASVLFEKNAEIVNGIYRLRSIYASKTGDNWYSVSLSAATGKSIEFRDSVYIYDSISLVLNAEYTDTDGKTHLQTGDIIFTGATTEADLLQVKGRAGTADEVLNSRTTEIYALTMLYGGRLRVEDGAVYKGHGIRTIKDSDSTIRVKDAILDHAGYTIRLNSGTTLELEGANKITASNLEMDDGSSINFVLDSDNLNQNALTLSGNLILNGDIQIQLNGDYSLGGVYNLVSGGIISANKDCLSLPDTVDYNVVLTDSALSLVVWKDVATPETVEDWQHISSGSRITVNRDVVLCDLVANGNVYKLSGEGSLGVSEKLTVTGGADVTLELDTIAAGVELAGGTLTFRGTSLSLGAVEVSANSTLEIWDQTGSDGVAAEACSIASLDMAADLNLATTRKSKLHIATLTGEGNLTVGSSREKHEVAIADISAYDGTFTVRGGNSTLALNLGADEVLNSSRVTKDSDSALLLNGQGTYSLESLENVGADFSLASQVQFGDSWSGTLELKNGTAAGLEWNDFAAAGKVTVNGMSGWFDYFNPADIHIQLEGAGMTVLDSSKKTYKYQKGISGSGDFVVQSKSAYESWYEMRGDMEAWRGAFRVLQSAKSENAATVNLTLNGGGILFDGSEGSGVYLERTGTLNVTIGHADTASVLKGDIRNVGMTDGETTTFGSLNVTLNHEVEVQGDIQATSMKIGAGADIRTSGMVQATRCELAGGKLLHHGQNIMFGSMDVSADSVLEIVERAGNNGLAAKVCTIESLNLNAALNQIITGKCTLEIDTLTGSGPLAIQSRNEKHNVTINDISGYTGNISLSSANTTLALNLGKDVVLDSARVTKDDDSSLLLKGTGSYNIGTAREIAAGVSFAEDWQGSVRLTGTLAGDTLSSLSDEDSWVELYGVSGYLSRADATAGEQTYSANLKLTNAGSAAAWDLNNGYHQDVRIFSGAISGTGALLRSSYKGREQTLQFTGDVSGWTGELRHQPTIATYGGSVVETDVTFSGSSEINVAMTTNGLGELNVTIDDEYLAAGSQVRVNSSINATSLTVTEGTTMQLKNTATLGGNITIQATAEGSAALLSGVNVKGNMLEGMGANARLKDMWMEAVNEAYGISDVDMQNVHFSAALATLELSNVSFDESCTFTVGAEGSIVLSNAVVHIGIPTTGMNGEVLTVDLSNLFQCNVQGALTLALDTDALRAAGYTAVQVDFGSDADEDYSQLSMKMNGAVYSGIDGNIAEFALVPEPATTTLSLLALTALAIRRRRAA